MTSVLASEDSRWPVHSREPGLAPISQDWDSLLERAESPVGRNPISQLSHETLSQRIVQSAKRALLFFTESIENAVLALASKKVFPFYHLMFVLLPPMKWVLDYGVVAPLVTAATYAIAIRGWVENLSFCFYHPEWALEGREQRVLDEVSAVRETRSLSTDPIHREIDEKIEQLRTGTELSFSTNGNPLLTRQIDPFLFSLRQAYLLEILELPGALYQQTEEKQQEVLKLITQLPYLKILDLACNRLKNVEERFLSSLLNNTRQLTTLRLMAAFPLTSGHADLFVSVFKSYSALTWLDLSLMGITDEIASRLAEGLRHNRSLQWLRMRHNQMTQVGLEELILGINESQTLRGFDFSLNDLSERENGDFQWQAALRNNTSLEWLDLSACHINDLSAQQLAFVIRSHPKLVFFDLSYNWIHKPGIRALKKAAEKQGKVEIDFFYNAEEEDAPLGDLGGYVAGMLSEEMARENRVEFPELASTDELLSVNWEELKKVSSFFPNLEPNLE